MVTTEKLKASNLIVLVELSHFVKKFAYKLSLN